MELGSKLDEKGLRCELLQSLGSHVRLQVHQLRAMVSLHLSLSPHLVVSLLYLRIEQAVALSDVVQ